jgi:hypothetical protein
MSKSIRYLGVAGLLVFAAAGFAQDYAMNLYSTYNGQSAVLGGQDVYISPYTATIANGAQGQNGAQIFNGSIICDDFTTDIPLPYSWTATATNAASVNSSDKFYNGGAGTLAGYTAQQDYNAAAYLAVELVGAIVENPDQAQYDEQADISAAIWDIFDPALASTGVDGKAISEYEDAALAAAVGGYQGTNVTVFTANPPTGSQEFLVVGGGPGGGPLIQTPEPTSAAVLGVDLLSVLAVLFLLRRYRVRT